MIDFKKFKKVEANEKFTVLQHDNGHEIKIAHKGLSDSHLKELEKMPVHAASGGKMKGMRGAYRFKESYYTQRPGHGVGPETARVSQPSQPAAPSGFTEPRDIGTPLKKLIVPKTPRGERHEYAQNIDVARTADKGGYPPCINPSCKSYGRPHPNCLCYGGTERLAEGGSVGGYCSQGNRPHQAGCEYFDDGGTVETPQDTPPPVPQSDPNLDAMSATNPYDTTQNVPISPQEHVQQQTQELLGHDAAIQSDLAAGHIKPETYKDLFAKKDTLGKIGTLFGLMVGGAGSGLSKQPNMLMGMMNNEIQNDLKAQQDSNVNRQNLLRINQEALTHLGQAHLSEAEARAKAIATTNMQMNRIALDHLANERKKIPDGSPQAQAWDQMLTILAPMIDKESSTIATKHAIASAIQRFGFGGNRGGGSAPAPAQAPKTKKQQSAQAASMGATQGPVAQQPSPGFWDNVHNQGFFNAITPYLPKGASEATSPGSNQPGDFTVGDVPEVPLPQFTVDSEGIKQSQYLGQSGSVPGQIGPGEIGQANEEMGKAHQFNDKIGLIHQNFGELWKNRSDANATLKWLSDLGGNVFGFHIQPPDMTSWTETSKNYYRAANRIRQELGSLVGNGALTQEQAESVLTNLIKQNDTPEDFKNVVKQVDGNLMSNIKTPVLEKYRKIRRPKIAE